MADEVDFSSADAGASQTYPQQCSALRKNGHVMIKGNACKIVDMSTSKTGKHGHAKVHIVGIDIFDGKKYEDLSPSTHNMDVPNISRTQYALLDIADGDNFLDLMDEKAGGGATKQDVKLPEGEIGDRIREAFDKGESVDVVVLAALGREQVIDLKVSASG